uniref:Chitin-binding type-4 domain-containing protein n=1 Tax=Ciona savignyi TaxID=51511 RepID=H2ZBC8_CIOSA
VIQLNILTKKVGLYSSIYTGLVALMLIHTARPHGRMMEPPNRSSLWRFWDTDPAIAPYKSIIEPNYGDNELFCGGFQHQVNLDGKCGICGDAYDKERENEAGGKYGKGIIVRQYQPGKRSVFEAKVDLTAHHLGFFEFRLCKWDNPTKPVTQDPVVRIQYFYSGSSYGDTQYFPEKPGSTVTTYTIRLKLPPGLTCSQCVIQWRYHAGNSWGYDDDGNYCTGCGPQEEFYGCADVAVGTGPTLPPP